jgi:hypothetical protein
MFCWLGEFITVAYIFLALGLLMFFYEKLDSFTLFGVAAKFREAKQSINIQSEKLEWRLLVRSIVLDCNGDIKKEIFHFLTCPNNIGRTLKISQTDDYSLQVLSENQFITYQQLPGTGSVNMVSVKYLYELTLRKPLAI